eukprot:5870955-Prymnesium_polylepis.1
MGSTGRCRKGDRWGGATRKRAGHPHKRCTGRSPTAGCAGWHTRAEGRATCVRGAQCAAHGST